jgi:hypothetical protein
MRERERERTYLLNKQRERYLRSCEEGEESDRQLVVDCCCRWSMADSDPPSRFREVDKSNFGCDWRFNLKRGRRTKSESARESFKKRGFQFSCPNIGWEDGLVIFNIMRLIRKTVNTGQNNTAHNKIVMT